MCSRRQAICHKLLVGQCPEKLTVSQSNARACCPCIIIIIVQPFRTLHCFGRQSNCRRFRVKFSKSNGRSAVDNCRQVIAEISPHIHVREVSTGCGPETDSQAQMDVDSQMVSPESQNTQGNAATVRSTTSNSIPSSDAKGLTVSDLARKVSW